VLDILRFLQKVKITEPTVFSTHYAA